MPAPHAHADGDLIDFTGTFVTCRVIETENTTVHRLTFEISEDTHQTLLAPDSGGRANELLTGAEYEITAAQYCLTTTDAERSGETCPSCDEPLREAIAIDGESDALRQAADILGLEDPFTVAISPTDIRRTDREVVDDWTHMDQRSSSLTFDFVCDNCGEKYTERELRAPEQHGDHAEQAVLESPAMSESIGLSTGGAKDVSNFRENIEQGYTPKPGSISTEGLFYDYYFETDGKSPETDALFSPQYAAGVSEHPNSGDDQQFLAVGLDSTLSTAEFQRPQLDLVAVLDVSGSMDSPFDDYYYDEHGRRREAETSSERKIDAATGALCALTEQLAADDRLGVVLFNNRAHVAKPLREVGETDMDAIRQHIREVSAGGGTNMEDGFEAAWDLLQDAPAGPDTERRVVFMTDMMPNMGQTEESPLRQRFADAASEGIHTTFLGMGLDENADLADAVSDVKGANHYFVHSVEEFEQRLGDEFEYMVSPLVFDLQLELESDDCTIASVHGAPGNDAGEQLMHVTTLFPSPKSDGETRGGIVLVELDCSPEADVELVASWVERNGNTESERLTVDLPTEAPTYEHSGVRKGVTLARYAETLRTWARDVHKRADGPSGVDDWIEPDRPRDQERESVPLTVSEAHAKRFKTLRAYLVAEANAIGDETLLQEARLLETLCSKAGVEIQPTVDPGGESN